MRALEDAPNPLPADYLINVHVYRTAEALTWLRSREVPVIALARHPLDVLVSVFQYARLQPAVHRWLNGDCRIPRDTTLAPEDPEAVAWMRSDGASSLLSVSLQWWRDPDVIARLR
jgi:hypothetical protein